MISGDTTKVRNMVRFSKGADVLVHEGLSNTLVEMLAGALDNAGNARQGTMARQIMSYHTTPDRGRGHRQGGRGAAARCSPTWCRRSGTR